MTDSNEHYLTYVRYMTVPEASQSGPIWDAGNDVTGKTPAEIQAIVDAIKALETDTIRRDIFDKMKVSATEWFTFSDTDEAKKTVKLRLEVIAKIKQMNNDKFYWYDLNGSPYETEATNWKPLYRGSYWWVQKSGTAYQAITELANGTKKTEGECYGAVIACVWWGCAQALGATDFNAKYPGTNALKMHRFQKVGSYRAKQVTYASDTSVHVPGDWIYMKNHNYGMVIDKKTNNKEFWKKKWLVSSQDLAWQGENAICIGNTRYEGLGVNFVNKTEAEMREKLRGKYNEDLEKVIDNGGKVGGVAVTKITAGAEALTKIKWRSHKRIHN